MSLTSAEVPLTEAVKALYPPRMGRLSSSSFTSAPSSSSTSFTRAASSSLAGVGGGVGRGGGGGVGRSASFNLLDVSSHHGVSGTAPGAGGGSRRQRFSQLLLEHGELHLQDWAVVASSSLSSSGAGGAAGGAGGAAGGRMGAASPTSAAADARGRRGSASKISNKGNTDFDPPSTTMGSIPGRLRLCTRSVVFEPDDPTRGIVRCPFVRMVGPPHAATVSVAGGRHGRGGGRGAGNGAAAGKDAAADGGGAAPQAAVVVRTDRHVVMKSNNVVAPFDSVEIPTEFRFAFCHSPPSQFFELSKKLFGMVVTKHPPVNGGQQEQQRQQQRQEQHQQPATTLEDILQPMLDRPFDPSNFVDVRERPLTSNLRCRLQTPLLTQPGCSIVTSDRVYFQPVSGVFSTVAARAISWSMEEIVATARRYHGLRDCALEIYLVSGTSVLLAFETARERERVMTLLPRSVPCHTDRTFVIAAYEGWREGQISNFEYLLALNSASGRTFHDLSRYPVFPWVVADYTSKILDLDSPATFRDLSKPVGALNEERLEYFKTRWKGMEDMDHPFLYGTHYSAPGYVLYYLVRSMPEHMLCLQNGKFDAPDRMFHDLYNCYSSVLINHADVKELIAEFYDPGAGFDFLINARGLQLGTTQTGDRVHDIKLPPWAKSPRDFLRKNRKALESDICTSMLPRWIDLIFGDKSRGEGAKEALNLFHPMAYLSAADFDAMKTEEERMQAELQATEFGIVPDLLFNHPHPSKSDMDASPDDFVAPDAGRARNMSLEDLGDEGDFGKTNGQNGDQPWELLETPTPVKSSDEDDPIGDRLGSAASDAEHGTLSPVGLGASAFVPPSTAAMATYEAKDVVASSFDAEESKRDNARFAQESTADPVTKESFASPKRNGSHYPIDGFGRATISPQESSSKSKLSLRGSGQASSSRRQGSSGNKKYLESSGSFGPDLSAGQTSRQDRPEESSSTWNATKHNGWEMKPLTTKKLHGDTVSGCSLLVQEGAQKLSYLVTASLDGRLLVHTLPSLQDDYESQEQKRKSFSATKASTISSRLSYLGLVSGDKSPSSAFRLNELRSHSSSDPLACLALTTDAGGHIAFAGGHDDVVFAYGINSACALASVYSHRDAVTGIDLIQRSSFENDLVFGSGAASSAKSTHIMVSGSWDATVKVWSVSVDAGETVSIDREPLAELFDADASVVCVSATEVYGTGVAICAGCADGSFVVWLCHNNGANEVLYKEEARRGYGPCASVKWAPGQYLFAGFGSGRVASYVLKNGAIRRISKIQVGSPVQCLAMSEENLFVGCADGGLRLVPVGDGAYFDSSPQPWTDVNGRASPALSSISVAAVTSNSQGRRCVCVTGAEDGSISLFELNEVS